MNEDAVPTVVVAGLCIVAAGYTAAALPPSLSTHPREALTEGGVPVVSDVVLQVRPLAIRFADALRGDVSPPPDATPPPSVTPPASAEYSGTPPEGYSGTPPENVEYSGDADLENRTGSPESPGASDDADGGDGLGLPRFLPLVGVAAGVGWYLRRRRGHSARAAEDGNSTPTGGRSDSASPPAASTDTATDALADENGVYRAWTELLDAAEIDRPSALTPAECAARAVDRGYDADAVDRLRTVFEEVRYGDGAATDRRVRRAEAALRDAGVRE